VAVVILHVHKYKKLNRKFNWGGLHERHVVATWNLENQQSPGDCMEKFGHQVHPWKYHCRRYITS